MTDILPELRRLASQATPATPFVRVTADMLNRAADEIEKLRKRDDNRTDAVLFDEEGIRT